MLQGRSSLWYTNDMFYEISATGDVGSHVFWSNTWFVMMMAESSSLGATRTPTFYGATSTTHDYGPLSHDICFKYENMF